MFVPSSFLSHSFPVIFLPYVSPVYFSTTSYLLYLPSLFSIFFLSRFHILNHHYLSLLFLFLVFYAYHSFYYYFYFTSVLSYFTSLFRLFYLSYLPYAGLG